MILYLLKSGIYLLVVLLFHRLFLEKERLYRFNRFYLTGSLVVSFLVPLLSFPLNEPTHIAPVQQIWQGIETTLNPVVAAPQASVPATGMWAVIYWLVTAVLLARFGWNLYALLSKINGASTFPVNGATLVLLPETTLPYTFLHYLFVNQHEYETGAIERELYTHERAHVRQRHSLDILFIEGVGCFLWFNPLLLWLKRAVRLNHEFLADEAVTRQYADVGFYQQLLYRRLIPQQQLSLTSNLSFQTTKKRFVMMTKHTSPVRQWALMSSSALLLTGLFAAITTTVAQQLPVSKPAKPQPVSTPQVQTPVADMERLYSDKVVHVPIKPNVPKSGEKKFSDLSAEEKKRVVLVPPMPRKTPTEAEFRAWKNPKKYGVWVNDKRTRSFPNTTLKAGDIVSYYSSYVHKNARQPEGYLYQIDLMTEDYYQQYVAKHEANPFLMLRGDK